ncbi:unnamed protein product [Rotaria magnacalcarata]|uniref:Uncharacterized protein n=1 Tax=Rotaria magnacalcarata TaxID=392030 RepID=A0A816URH2_9BILA|nr:unnamed protein product [Rotaria magnacalcarata]CAF1394918.1 unnamed protein product [Rotaria magnacalcarata]CAF2111518.1 unnamed protein product [Rotaria magnacalcarata]CAF2157919.1 unnamed protein product [Rotaria magnacalcarata]CAF2247645.1 unnamed protein product [Rotaria magnacalcarata]
MSNKTSKLLTSKTVIKVNSPKHPVTPPNSLYSGTESAVRTIQQPRSLRSRYSAQSKRVADRTNIYVQETYEIQPIHHPWKAEYHKIITREKFIKPMAKDPYTEMRRLVCHATGSLTTKTECCSGLFAPEDVKEEILNIQEAPKRSIPSLVRYLRRTDLMPSERLVLPPINIPAKATLLCKPKYQKSTVSVMDTSQLTNTVANAVTTNRLSNRPKIKNDAPIIRKPSRKLVLNVSHETMMPLSVYG